MLFWLCACSALAATGGVSAGGASATATRTRRRRRRRSDDQATPAVKKPHAPVTSKSTSLVYKGPVYEKTATGQVVPYVPRRRPAK